MLIDSDEDVYLTEEKSPQGACRAGDGVGHGMQRRTGHLRQRGQVNNLINHVHHGITKAAAGDVDNGSWPQRRQPRGRNRHARDDAQQRQDPHQ